MWGLVVRDDGGGEQKAKVDRDWSTVLHIKIICIYIGVLHVRTCIIPLVF